MGYRADMGRHRCTIVWRSGEKKVGREEGQIAGKTRGEFKQRGQGAQRKRSSFSG